MAFGAPVGTEAERATGQIWPGRWFDATGYLTSYSLGYHTGADLNLNYPSFDRDRHAPVYAMGDGVVTYAQLYSRRVWGKLIVIDHGTVDGNPLLSRYGHVATIDVQVGQQVTTGTPIGTVGNAEGLFPYHLHFDISITDRLRTEPSHWPGADRGGVLRHYVDPKGWLQGHVGVALPPAHDWYVIAAIGLRVRDNHSTHSRQIGSLPYGSRVMLEDGANVNQDGYIWGHISGGMFNGDWLATGKTDLSETYVSANPPGM